MVVTTLVNQCFILVIANLTKIKMEAVSYIGKRVLLNTIEGAFEGDIDNMNLVSKKISLRNGKVFCYLV